MVLFSFLYILDRDGKENVGRMTASILLETIIKYHSDIKLLKNKLSIKGG